MIDSLYDIFKPWSDKGFVWLIADTHFGDPDCKLMDPDWPEPRRAVRMINKCVKKQDTIIILGDVGDPRYVEHIRAAHKVLITGNHDRRGECRPYFDEVYSGPLFISEKILLSHEPVHGLPYCLNIHGHDHNNADNYDDGGHYLNLASNVCGYKPVSLGALIKEGKLSKIHNIHRMAIDGAVMRKKMQENKRLQIEQGEEHPDITRVPEGESLVIGFANCEVAAIPADQVETLELSGVYSLYLVDKKTEEREEFKRCRRAVLILKEGADIAGKSCEMWDDYTVFERVNSIYPDICSIGFTHNGGFDAESSKSDIGVPWPEEGWCSDNVNHAQRSWVKDGKLYLYIADDFEYPYSFRPVHHEWREEMRKEAAEKEAVYEDAAVVQEG